MKIKKLITLSYTRDNSEVPKYQNFTFYIKL